MAKNISLEKLEKYSIDYYTGIIPNRIVKVYHDKYFKYKYFNIIKCQNEKNIMSVMST